MGENQSFKGITCFKDMKQQRVWYVLRNQKKATVSWKIVTKREG